MDDARRFLHLSDISVIFKGKNKKRGSLITLDVDNEHYESGRLDASNNKWACNLYLFSQAKATVTLHSDNRFLAFANGHSTTAVVDLSQAKDGEELKVAGSDRNIHYCLSFKESLPLEKVVPLLGKGISSALENKVIFLNKIEKVSSFLKGVIDIGATLSDLNPVAKAVFNVVTMVFQKFQQQQECHKRALDLLDSVVSKLPFAEIIPKNMQSKEIRNALNKMLDHIKKIFLFLDKYAATPTRKDFTNSRIDEIVDLQKKLQDLRDDFNTIVTSEHYRMDREAKDIDALAKLKPILTALYNQDQKCLPGTREELLNIVMNWAKSPISADSALETLFWLFGLAGSGKSAIASTICDQLHQNGLLAGSFNCKRDIPEQREARNIFPTLAYCLARICKPYRDEILHVLESESAIENMETSTQLRLLFTEPMIRLNKTVNFDKATPYIFVIDALDECGVLRTRTQIAGHLTQLAGTSNWLKILVTSRPLPELYSKFDRTKCPHSKSVDLAAINAEDDIYQYTKRSLEEVASNQGLDDKWLEDDFIKLLSRKASGLFIWTSTVMRYVEKRYDKDAAFNMILSGSVGLDSLYLKIIRGSQGGLDTEDLQLVKTVLGMLYITAKNRPLTIDALYEFRVMSANGTKLSKSTLRAIMNDLKSVLYEDTSKGNVIRVCHPSLLDFISDKSRCEEFWTDPEILDNEMAIKCLIMMDEGLKFNICHLESSQVRNEDVEDLPQRIKEFISETLQYSCSYWIDHVGTIDSEEQRLMNKIFGGLKVLYWIEVLSLLCELQKCIPKLQILLNINKENDPMTTAVMDVHRYITFFYEAMSVSTPHIYISAFTWLPEESYLAKLLYPFFRNQPAIEYGRESKWQSSLWVKSMGGSVNSVAFHPDGTKIAAASNDGTISIWDVDSGEKTGVLTGHSSSVLCLAWSPDGSRIISGSYNYMHVWNAKTYIRVGGSWEDHTSCVDAVACSLNDKYVASGGCGKKIFLWYADGRGVKDILLGHLGAVWTVAFSPDSKTLASGSNDNTIRLWVVETGDILRLIEHVDWISCVTFSHNGRLLAAASYDDTLTLWDPKTGEKYKEPFVGHYNAVRSIAFSPNDKLIASGSDDLTVRLWDVETGLQQGQPFRGHMHRIPSVAFSFNGKHIASCAYDNTVRLWDVTTNAPVEQVVKDRGGVACKGLDIRHDGFRVISGTEDGAIHIWDATSFTKLKTLDGHTALIHSLKYSLDGKYILSASYDCSIRIWDADSGEQLNCPNLALDGRTRSYTIALNPDRKRFATSGSDSKIRIWDIATGEEMIEAFPCHGQSEIFALCYSKDGTLLASGGEDNLINLWQTGNMEPLGKPFGGHTDTIMTLTFSVNAEKLVSGGCDNTVRIWSVMTGELLHNIDRHTDWVTRICLSPDGSRFVTASDDKDLCVWDLETAKRVGRPMRGHSSRVRDVVYTPDGEKIISVSTDSTLRIWDAEATRTNYVPELDMRLSDLGMVDGWIRNREGGLVIWVPPEQRNGLKDVCLRCIPEDGLGHPVRLDWKKIIMDGNWTDILKI